MPSKKTIGLLVFAGFLLAVILIFSSPKKQERPLTALDFPPESHVVIEESENSIVKNFPDVPQYPASEIINSKSYTEEGGEGYSLDLSTNDPVMDVIDWYREVLDEKDWNLIFESEMTEEPSYFLIEYKKPDIQLDVSAIKQDSGETRIVITHHFNMGEYGPTVRYE